MSSVLAFPESKTNQPGVDDIILDSAGRKVVLITGSGSGLGAAIVTCMLKNKKTFKPIAFDTKHGDDVRAPGDLVAALASIGVSKLDILINCAGVNRIDWLENFTDTAWDEVMDVNAKGIFMMTRAALPLLKESRGTVLNIVSNASHMPMTCSLAYNASKGAAHIMTLQLARELTRKHNITVFGISPNKLTGTGMSADIDRQVVETRGWTAEHAKEYQRNALLTGEETDPAVLADFIVYLLSEKQHHKFLTGCVIPYGA
jgi:NAD(P)-dependent dehydrogenase (short-subunit alcohol dehydrogenase family)